MEECPTCGGKGHAVIRQQDGIFASTRWIECPKCNGRGVVNSARDKFKNPSVLKGYRTF